MPSIMDVFHELPVDQVIHLLARKNEYGVYDEKERQEFDTPRGKVNVRINSLRLRCFARSIVCVSCSLKGHVFRIERSAHGPRGNPHLNLYAMRGDELVLMTKDHIIPKSKKGADCLSNLQTMCCDCNSAKGDRVHPLDNPLGRV